MYFLIENGDFIIGRLAIKVLFISALAISQTVSFFSNRKIQSNKKTQYYLG